MPLPDGTGKVMWPPHVMHHIYARFAEWDAWYVGDADALATVYGSNATGPRILDHYSQYRGGVIGKVSRWWWGTPSREMFRTKLHVPLAADICAASADLLFSEPPTIAVDDEPKINDRINAIIDGGKVRTLCSEAAEVCAALGTVYLRATWDTAIADYPFPTRVDADGAIPEYRWGRLTAVTFWRELHRKDGEVWRHLERHEQDLTGVGWIFHGLYKGTDDTLGRAMPLEDMAATAGFAPVVNDLGGISTLSPGLDVVQVRNRGPQRRWRKHTIGCHLGRSDLDGIEPILDAVDEVYSSWMRDVRQAKARLVAAESTLHGLGNAGQGGWIDLDQEVFSALPGVLPGRDQGNGLPIESIQFAIRADEHKATAQEFIDMAIHDAGYSGQTFGQDREARGPATATEVVAREKRSYSTRDAKIGEWAPALELLFTKMMAMDAVMFAGTAPAGRVQVEFPDGVQDSLISLAQTAQALRAAEAASDETVVALVHPDWDERQVNDEVAKIRDEAPAAPDPATLGGAPTPPDAQPGNTFGGRQ